MTSTRSVQKTYKNKCEVNIAFRIEKFAELMETRGQNPVDLWSEGASLQQLPSALWKMRIFAHSAAEKFKDHCYFRIYLTGLMVANKETIDATVQLYLPHDGLVGGKMQIIAKRLCRFDADSYCVSGYLRNKTVLPSLNKEDGSLLVMAQVGMLVKSARAAAARVPKAVAAVPKVPNVVIKLPSVEKEEEEAAALKASQLNLIGELLEKGLNSDCTIVVGDESFRVHKCILSASSPTFAAMFDVAGEEGEEYEGINMDTVCINEFQPEPVKALLDFIYRGEINWGAYTDEELHRGVEADVLRLAGKYALLGLKAHVEGRLAAAGIASPAQLAEMAALADLHSCPTLMKACSSYLASNRKSVVASAEWKELKTTQPKLGLELLETLE